MTDPFLLGYPVITTSPTLGSSAPQSVLYEYLKGTRLAGLRVKAAATPTTAPSLGSVQALWYGISADGAPLEGPWVALAEGPQERQYSEVALPRGSTLASIEVLGIRTSSPKPCQQGPCARTGGVPSSLVQGFRLVWTDGGGRRQEGVCAVAGAQGALSLGACATPDVPVGFTFYLQGRACCGVEISQGPLPSSVQYTQVRGPADPVPAPVVTTFAFSDQASSSAGSGADPTLSASMQTSQTLTFTDSLLGALVVPISQPASLAISPLVSDVAYAPSTTWQIPLSMPVALLEATSTPVTASRPLNFSRSCSPGQGQQLQLAVQQTAVAPTVRISGTGLAAYSWSSDEGPVQLPPRPAQLAYTYSGVLSVSSDLRDVAASAASLPVVVPPAA